jgi:hypothetical protein
LHTVGTKVLVTLNIKIASYQTLFSIEFVLLFPVALIRILAQGPKNRTGLCQDLVFLRPDNFVHQTQLAQILIYTFSCGLRAVTGFKYTSGL